MAKDFKDLIADVKEAYDLADYIENSGISLKVSGSRYKGLCPFHNEKSPSFNVDSYFQTYHCFGCSAHGDILAYVQETEAMSFREALLSLAEAKGIDTDVLNDDKDDKEDKVDIASLREVVKESARFFWRNYKGLPEDHRAKEEVRGRKLTVKNTYNIYGYAPEGGKKLYEYLKSKNFSDENIELAGVCKKSEKTGRFFDFWQGRLIFIISDITGRPVGFSGRKLYDTDTMGKYVNSSDSPVFNKSNVLFNSHTAKIRAKQEQLIYVVEGQFDVMSILEATIDNVVASSGTAFTDRQSSQLRRMVGEDGKIVFCFDGDESGLKAAEKVFDTDPLLQSRAYVVKFPEAQDPNDYGKKHGYDKLQEYVESNRNQVSIIEFVLDAAAASMDLSTPEGRAQYIVKAATILKKISNSTLQREYKKQVSLKAGGVPLSELDAAIKDTVIKEAPRSRESEDEIKEDSSIEREKYLNDDEKQKAFEEKIINALDNENYHSYVGKLLWLALSRRDLLSEKVYKLKDVLIPKAYHRILEELYNYDDNKPLLVERFSDTAIIENIIQNRKPSVYIVTSDDETIMDLFGIIVRRMVENRVRAKRDDKRAKLLSILNTGESSAEVLRQVVEEQQKEKERIGKIMSYIQI